MKHYLQTSSKLRKIMKITIGQIAVMLMLTGISQAKIARAQNALDRDISLNIENASLNTVLNQIEDKASVQFVYSKNFIHVEQLVSIIVTHEKLAKVLDKLLTPYQIRYEVVNDRIVLKKTKNKLNDGASIIANDNLTVQQQIDIKISGHVVAEDNSPLPGVNILIKGTSLGTTSDADGMYSIAVPNQESVLVFSFIGYAAREISVGSLTTLDVTLSSEIKSLEEIVVIGYGTQRKSDLTGSVSSVTGQEMKALPVTRVDQALQGRTAGVVVQNNDASPNSSVTIRVRGSNSINGTNDPLIVINGFIGGDLSSINPNDIEAIEVLKDASATAIYGSRGANGVIIVTTKRGTSNKPTVQFNTFFSEQFLRKKLSLLNAGNYAETVNANRTELGLTAPYTADEVASFKANGGTDWQDQIFKRALQQSHQLSISGGSDNISYYLSGNIVDNQGIIKGSSFKRYSIRSNIESHVNDRLKIGLNLFLSTSTDHPTTLNDFAGSASGSPVYNARLWAPTLNVYDPQGNYTLPSSKVGPHTLYNPLALAAEPIRDNRQTINEFNTYAEYTIIKGLTARIMGAARMIDDENSYYINTKATGGVGTSSAGITNARRTVLQNTNQLNYQKTFANVHTVSITAVYEQQVEQLNNNFAGSKGFLTDAVTYNNLGLGSSPAYPSSFQSKKAIESFVGRFNYSFHDKYLINFTGRYDGASVFGKDHKWGFFPSGAIAWRVSEEEFLKNIYQISNLKLRGSYGVTGSQGINPYTSLDQLNTGASYSINGSTLSTGVTIGSLGNPDLRWEKTAQVDVGVDLGLLNDRIFFTIDYYRKKTSDLLMNVPVPLASGYSSVLKNLGEVENKGVEFSLGGKPLDKAITWNTSFNMSINKNKVLALSGEKEITLGGPGLPNFGNTVFLVVGQPMGVLKGYIQNGVWGTPEETQAASYGVEPGAPKYADKTPDGVINDKDIVIMGNTLPKFTFGWTNTFSFKNFDLNVLIQGTQGNKIYNLSRVYTDRFSSDADATSTRILDHWTTEHQNTNVPSFIGTNKYEQLQSNRWLENGSYIRFKNITLGYNIPKVLSNAIKIKSARVYLSGVNLITITKYTGYDPEARTDVDKMGGIDLASYPSQNLIR